MDETDRKLLKALQQDAQMTAQDLGDYLNLSPSQAGRRRARLEEQGYIRAYAARLDPTRLGLQVQAFVQVQMESQSPESARAFLRLVNFRSEVTSVWTLTGNSDYLMRVYCSDLSALNVLIHEVLLPHPSVARVQSQIVLDHVKQDAPLPTDHG
ncbi:DNA-binding transcriptional regulator, Lrp family [Aliiroseovarius sediminilitoris]|uniref:DNA-binding transcriptional regulator, Lrp family n=1 Tax=Aliiroseovarius sediminilitoris TaxID=1173584 RepID=A0A1I0PJ04_9RHOB|nr:Lrp/AsnC family transcriptional regulator [Aliiroseovarius sediminilitoris]SEW14233.1 DNA-binding transcriptional regulator, Lrp family [Aliiroseovarius sediminilitoris]